ncbi:Susd and RagB outer membrane lipoprotein [Pedobacter steynii]|uniref:Susd and RagB outer membrane lipoprotein n=1 Tax=Pedobacter steynii TaxID=430522 RepID=A0A1G9IXB8_9SPHI|nr:RagB/SusD family nutrient uptake outer membrane protein [Pedobacter steynii]SDL29696.1 Susd and RagB outer membrane lipoprotein [Pedobacter steynii]
MRTLIKTTKLSAAIFAATFVMVQSSCTKDFDKYNANPNGLTEEDLLKDNISSGIFIPEMQVNVMYCKTNEDYIYQIQQNLNADIFSGYFAPPGDFGGPNNSTYALKNGWNLWPFKVGYNGVMNGWREVTKRAVANPQFIAVANIIKVEGMHRVSDIYGPIPYSKFGSGSLATPYDDQETVYNTFFKDLDDAIKVLTEFVTKNPSDNSLNRFDLVYDGNYIQWIKFANSLKLRLAVRIAYANPALAKTKAEEAVSNSYGMLAVNGDNALVKSGKGVPTRNGLWVDDLSYNDTRMNASAESILKGFKDPRLSKYFMTSKVIPGDYKGVRSGISFSGKPDAYLNSSSSTLKENTPVQYMCAAEVAFLRAEGALRGWSMGGSAQSFYEQGVKTSFEQYTLGSTDASTYLNNNTDTQAPYTDPINVANNVAANSPLLSKTTIKWDEGATMEQKLERIITQKWIAIFPDGQEAWSEFRRTGYPKIFPVVNNQSGGTINTEKQIRRLPFSEDEYKNNNAEVTKAVGLLNGADNGGTKLWWDKKN